MLGGVTWHMLPHLPGVPHPHVKFDVGIAGVTCIIEIQNWPVLESVSMKKKENLNPGSNQGFEPGPFVS